MKKYLLSLSIALLFVVHLIYQKGQSSATSGSLNSSADVANLINPPAATSTPSTQPAPASTSAAPPVSSASPTPAPVKPTPAPAPAPAPQGQYKNGTYTGSQEDAFYGYIQVQAQISGGRLAGITFLQYPNDRRQSIEINTQALPMLRSEAITAQTANVDIVSGATDSSYAFRQSLASALSQAKN